MSDKQPTVKSIVAKGAKLLDEKKPGWASKIKTDKLYMNSNDDCIIGQLFKGDCDKGLTKLGGIDPEEYGFMPRGFGCEDYNGAWLKEIKKREEAKAAPKKTVKKKEKG